MKKIFPFYKDQNIANNPLGYTNVNNARKRMKADEVIKDFEATLPENYWLDHIYVNQLENPWSSDWNDSIAADYLESDSSVRSVADFLCTVKDISL